MKNLHRTEAFIIVFFSIILSFGVISFAADNNAISPIAISCAVTSQKPAKPSNVKVKSKASTQITLSWNKVKNASKYYVYEYDGSTKKYTKVKTVTTDNAVVKDLKSSRTYVFCVKAVTLDGVKSNYSSKVSAKTDAMPQVKNLKASVKNNSVTLTWDKVSCAEKYRVYKYISSSKSYISVKTVTSNKVVIKNLKENAKYIYTVRAVSKAGSKGAYSKMIMVENAADALIMYYNPSTKRLIVDAERKDWYFIVVNSKREVSDSYTPKLKEILGCGAYLDYRVAPHYEDMYYAAKKDGIKLTPYSAYRSYNRQKRNYENLVSTYMKDEGLSRSAAEKKAATLILPPGTSEHNLGLAIDICNTKQAFAKTKEFAWLEKNAHKYGFILRYTAEKQSITGIAFEPWHWRYVGVENAKKIKDSGLCLEEYLDSISVKY